MVDQGSINNGITTKVVIKIVSTAVVVAEEASLEETTLGEGRETVEPAIGPTPQRMSSKIDIQKIITDSMTE